MNVLCLGSEIVGPSLARELVAVFLHAKFDGGERYVARLEKVEAMERMMKRWRSRDCMSWRRAASRSGSTTSRASSSHGGRARRDDGRGRRHRRHVEPDDLPEGDRRGRRLRRAAARVARRSSTTRRRSSSSSRSQDIARRVRRCCARVGDDRTASTATSRSRSTRRSPTTREAPSSRRSRLHERIDRPNLLREDPGDEPGLPAIEDCIARGKSINMTLIFSLRALRGGRRGVPARARAARRGRRRPVEGRVGRVVLRLARRHRGRQAARAARQRPSCRASSRSRTRSSRTSTSCEAFSGAALGVPRREGRDEAALPLGVDVDEEPGLPRRDVRRGADRARHGQHDAGRDDRGVPGPRRGRGDTVLEGVDEAQRLLERAARGRRRLRRRRRHARGGGRAEVRRLVRRAARGDPREARRSSRPREPSADGARRADLGARPDRLDRAATRRSGSAGSTSRCGCASSVDELLRVRRATVVGRHRRRRAARHGRLVARARGDAADASASSAFHVLDTTHPAAIRALEAQLDLERTLFVSASKSGSTLETRSHTDYFWEQRRAAASSSPRSPTRARSSSGSRASAASRAIFHGEPTIGGRYSALSPFGIVPAALMGVDVDRLLERARRRCRGVPRRRGQPGLELGLALGASWRDGRDKVCIDPNPGGFGLWVEQLLAESTGKQGKGLVPAPGEPPTGPTGRSRGRARRRRTSSAQEFFRWEFATAVAGSILGINPFDQPDVQAAKDKTNEVLARAASVGSSRRARSTSCSRRRAPATTSASRRSSTRRASDEALEPLVDRAREATGCVVTHGFGPRYLHSTGQLHKGGPNTGALPPGRRRHRRRARDPGPAVRLRTADPRAGGGRLRVAEGARPPRRARPDWRISRCSSG